MLIGLHGYQQVGKDTIAEILKERGFERVAFADPMRQALYKLNPPVIAGADVRRLVDSLGWEYIKREEPYKEVVRGMLQRLGTEVGRNMFGTDFWVQQGMKQAAGKSRVVFTDVRFENEIDAIHKAGGWVFYVNRPGYGKNGTHESERTFPGLCDRTILNDGDLDNLRKQIGLAFTGAGYALA